MFYMKVECYCGECFGIYPCIEIIVILFLVSYQRFLIRRIIDSISLEKDIGIENRTLIRIDTSS